MPSRTSTRTKNAVYYVENETIRGLIVIISEIGLNLNPLLKDKENLTKSILLSLEQSTLKVLQLNFYDNNSNTINNGYGIWNFFVSYNASEGGIVELPVNKVVQEIRHNKWAFTAASSYKITLWIKSGTTSVANAVGTTSRSAYSAAELPLNWGEGKRDGNSSSKNIYVGSFGYNPIDVTIYRQK
jgi:hypothetical protein